MGCPEPRSVSRAEGTAGGVKETKNEGPEDEDSLRAGTLEIKAGSDGILGSAVAIKALTAFCPRALKVGSFLGLRFS